MLAHRIKAHVRSDQPLVLSLPKGSPEGEVEVIVLFNAISETKHPARSLREFNDWLQQQPSGQRHREEIGQQIEAERDAWE